MSERVPKRLLWCDAEANAERLSSREGVTAVAEKAKRANIDALIVDVKPLGGEVLYTSRYAPRLGQVKGFRFPESFDLLEAMLEEGHSRGIEVHAAINVFSEGHREWGRGPAYEHPDWQVVMYEAVRTITLSDGSSLNVEFADPWNPTEAPAIYTRKSGRFLNAADGRCYAIIEGHIVTAVVEGSHVEIPVPALGCVLSLPLELPFETSPGDEVEFGVEHVFRPAAQSSTPSYGIFVNPIGPARGYELKVIEEIVSGYDIDGVIFDRMRYPNLYADFSPTSRSAFEEWLGAGRIAWPDDIFAINPLPWLPPIRGRYYREWLEWRARQIADFAGEAAALVRSIKPQVKLGVYVGSWYDSYYDVGVNWGSCRFHAGYPWMTSDYHETGFAELFDYLCTGCYYRVPTRREARLAGRPEGATVEAGCQLSCQAVAGAAPVYGSIYLRDYGGNPGGFKRAVETAAANSDGVMLFDLVYLEDYGWWPIIEEMFTGETASRT